MSSTSRCCERRGSTRSSRSASAGPRTRDRRLPSTSHPPRPTPLLQRGVPASPPPGGARKPTQPPGPPRPALSPFPASPPPPRLPSLASPARGQFRRPRIHAPRVYPRPIRRAHTHQEAEMALLLTLRGRFSTAHRAWRFFGSGIMNKVRVRGGGGGGGGRCGGDAGVRNASARGCGGRRTRRRATRRASRAGPEQPCGGRLRTAHPQPPSQPPSPSLSVAVLLAVPLCRSPPRHPSLSRPARTVARSSVSASSSRRPPASAPGWMRAGWSGSSSTGAAPACPAAATA